MKAENGHQKTGSIVCQKPVGASVISFFSHLYFHSKDISPLSLTLQIFSSAGPLPFNILFMTFLEMHTLCIFTYLDGLIPFHPSQFLPYCHASVKHIVTFKNIGSISLEKANKHRTLNNFLTLLSFRFSATKWEQKYITML